MVDLKECLMVIGFVVAFSPLLGVALTLDYFESKKVCDNGAFTYKWQDSKYLCSTGKKLK